jgi:hypothetical protein
MELNIGGTFSEFVNNVIITDDAIHVHKETKKRKAMTAPSGWAPPKYRTMYHHGSTNPPRQLHQHQHQHQHPHQQWAPCPPQRQDQWVAPKALPPPPPVMRLPAPPTTRITSGHTCFNCGRSGVHRAKEECHLGPRHPSATWSVEGGHCKDWLRQLHHHGGYS